LADSFGLAREDEVGSEMGEGFEDEAALRGAGVGDDEAQFVDDPVAVVDDVEVERAGVIDLAHGGATAADLKVLEKFEETAGRQAFRVNVDFSHGVEKRR
jgi:hypothetical protein